MAGNGEGGFILDPNTLAGKIQGWREKGYHVLSPAIQMSSFAPGYGVNASLVLLDPRVDENGNGPDCYFDKNTMDDDERAPGKLGLAKIAAAAGVSWVEPYGRRDPLTIQNLWIYQVTGVYLAYDGTPQVIKGEKEIDYRDGSAQIGEWSREAQRELEARNAAAPKGSRVEYAINGWSEKRVRQARTNGAERAETGALERAIRTLGVSHTYKVAELQKPFVALRVCPLIDMSDREVRAMVAGGAMAGVAKMYAQGVTGMTATRALPEAHVPERIIDVRPPVPVAAPAPVAPAPIPPPAPKAEEPTAEVPKAAPEMKKPESPARKAHPDAVTIVDVQTTEKPYAANHPTKAGRNFTIYTITLSNGVIGTTTFGKWGTKAKAMMTAKTAVIVQLAPPNRYNELEVLNIKTVDEGQPAPIPAGMEL